MDTLTKTLVTALGLALVPTLLACGNGEIGDPTGSESASSATASSAASTGAGGAGGAGGALASGGGGATGTGGAIDPGKPIFVIGGQDQRHLRSFDGMTWEDDVYVAPQGNKDNAFSSLAVGAGVALAAGDSGLWSSPDGKAWAQVPGQSSSLHASVAIYAGGRFVIVHSDGALTSTDGVVWEKASATGTAGHWSGIAYGAGRYLVVGDGGCRKVSEDGLVWHDYVCEDNGFTSFAYGAGVFVGLNAKGRHAVSLDGVTWTHDVTETDAALQGWQSVAFGAGHFVTAHGKTAFTTDDGVTWTKQGKGGPSQLVYAGGRFVGFSWRTDIYVSDDGNDFQKVWSADTVPDTFDATRMSPWFTGIGAGLLP